MVIRWLYDVMYHMTIVTMLHDTASLPSQRPNAAAVFAKARTSSCRRASPSPPGGCCAIWTRC